MDKLSDRVMALEGPDREVDALICDAIGASSFIPFSGFSCDDWVTEIGGKWVSCERHPGGYATNRDRIVPKFTKSLDAAMSLVPEGWQGVIHIGSEPSAGLFMLSDPRSHKNSRAATPALALCAAALKARGL